MTLEESLNRLAYQFKESVKLQGILTELYEQHSELRIDSGKLLTERTLNGSHGIQLDGIGEIVGVERPVVAVDTVGAFGFEGDPTSLGFGTLIDDTIGGNFILLNANGVLLNDEDYRTLIKARIILNSSSKTADESTNLISFMLGGVEVRYFLFQNLSPTYHIGKILSLFEKSLLEDIPTALGVGDANYQTMYNDTPFGFDGDSGALGFGTLNDPLIGGNFASTI